jgi:hypothetical protein
MTEVTWHGDELRLECVIEEVDNDVVLNRVTTDESWQRRMGNANVELESRMQNEKLRSRLNRVRWSMNEMLSHEIWGNQLWQKRQMREWQGKSLERIWRRLNEDLDGGWLDEWLKLVILGELNRKMLAGESFPKQTSDLRWKSTI